MFDADGRRLEMSIDDLPPDLADSVRAELDDGEKLVWVGQPRPDLYARQSGCLLAFGIFFTLFSLVWMSIPFGIGIVALGGANDGWILGTPFLCFGLFGLPFLAVGIGMLTSPFWMKGMAKKCCYALTDRRALTWDPQLFGGKKIRSYTRHGLGAIARSENADGSGSLVFHEETRRDSEGSTTTTRYGFLHIDGVRQVERLLRKTLLEDGAP